MRNGVEVSTEIAGKPVTVRLFRDTSRRWYFVNSGYRVCRFALRASSYRVVRRFSHGVN
jgi:hypothetical protein